MLIILTTDLFLLEWPQHAPPPQPDRLIQTDQGEKRVLRVLDDPLDLGLPAWIHDQRAHMAVAR